MTVAPIMNSWLVDCALGAFINGLLTTFYSCKLELAILLFIKALNTYPRLKVYNPDYHYYGVYLFDTAELGTRHNAQFRSAERIVLFIVFIFVLFGNGQGISENIRIVIWKGLCTKCINTQSFNVLKDHLFIH